MKKTIENNEEFFKLMQEISKMENEDDIDETPKFMENLKIKNKK